ncbi:MAG: C4-dicarboxylate ABC transporter substrate-binding protein, partial [Proteobacteria bacterium]|nr:C4-dicarboxylate ABC transporter substrate-binding protein [Pseudomonadota bacterium]
MKKIAKKLLPIFLIAMSASAVTIKLGSLAPQNSPWDDALQQLSAEWSKVSGGTVKMKIYPGGIAGDEADMLRKMKANLLGGSALTGLGMNDLYPGILAAQLPLQFESPEEFEYVFDKMKPTFEAELEKRGAKVVIWTQVGWIRFFSKNPVISPADMSKEKMFVYSGDGESVKVWRKAGFNPVPLSTND